MIFAGMPPINTLSGKIPDTTLPEATTQLLPILVPLRIVEFAPTQTLSPIKIFIDLSFSIPSNNYCV